MPDPTPTAKPQESPSKPQGTKELSVKQKKKKRELLEPGSLVASGSAKYLILDLLGSGGFGDVYKVCLMDDPEKIFAMKTEDEHIHDRLRRLKIEAEVLGECAKVNRPHFIHLIDKGRTMAFKFIVMPVVGPTLDKVRQYLSGKQFSKSTANKIAVQLMESLRDLHILKFLHRDLKPSNFAIGNNDDDRATIFMLDFGVAKRYISRKDDKLMIPRCKVAFMGTPRFCPRAAHCLQEQGRKDDLESLLYVIADTFNETYLPWRGQRDRLLVIQLKNKFMSECGGFSDEFEKNVPPGFMTVLRYINRLDNTSNPAYEFMISEFLDSIKDCAEPLDWLTDAYNPPVPVQKLIRKTATAVRLTAESVVKTAPVKNIVVTATTDTGTNKTSQSVDMPKDDKKNKSVKKVPPSEDKTYGGRARTQKSNDTLNTAVSRQNNSKKSRVSSTKSNKKGKRSAQPSEAVSVEAKTVTGILGRLFTRGVKKTSKLTNKKSETKIEEPTQGRSRE